MKASEKQARTRELGRARTYRAGSRRRLQKIRFRGNWSLEAILFFVSMLFILRWSSRLASPLTMLDVLRAAGVAFSSIQRVLMSLKPDPCRAASSC